MYSILLDSSNTSLSVGFTKEGELVCYSSFECWQEQSEHMIPVIDKLMNDNYISKDDLNKIVVSIGPGSYTGVRIALTIAKVMALALNIPLYPVSSLRVLKDDEKPSICLINARSNRSYFGVYKGNEVIIVDTIKTNDEVLEYIASHKDYSICGNVAYLGFENKNTNICKQMMSLISVLSPISDNLSAKPVYLKD